MFAGKKFNQCLGSQLEETIIFADEIRDIEKVTDYRCGRNF